LAFEQHVFISYAHLDNEPLTPGQKVRWYAEPGALPAAAASAAAVPAAASR